MTKKIIIKKVEDTKTIKKYSKGRTCLNCGINIDHRTPKVQFCCPNCKAIYKEREKYKANELPQMPKTKTTEDFHNDAASVYYPEERHRSASKQTKPLQPNTELNQIQKFYERYGK